MTEKPIHASVRRLYSIAKDAGDDAPAKVARRLNISPQTLNNWEARGISQSGSLTTQDVYGCNAIWITTGNGARMADASRLSATGADGSQLIGVRDRVASYETLASHVRLPLLEGFAGMGRGDYVGDYPEIVDYVEVTREWSEQKLRGVPTDVIRVITGRGDSMRGQYSDGDLVFIDSRVKQFVGDSAYCYRWNGQVQIKRLQLIGQGLVRILSKNPDYPAIDVSIDELEIGGRAVGAWAWTEF